MKRIKVTEVPQELRLVVDALNRVDSMYYQEPITHFDVATRQIVTTENIRTNESTFVTQLLSNIEALYSSVGIHQDKHYQTDPPKRLMFKNDEAARKYEHSFHALFDFDHDAFYKVPDIVIHGGPHDMNERNQIFLSEVKTTTSLTRHQFDVDFFKVNIYHEELRFQNSAFIIANMDHATIRTYIKNYRARGYYMTDRVGLYLLIKTSPQKETMVFAHQ